MCGEIFWWCCGGNLDEVGNSILEWVEMFLLLVDSLNLDFFINRFLDVKFFMLE